MISDLLKTPQQLREEQLNKLRALGQTNAQNALLAGRGGSAISGAISGLAAQGQSILPETMEGAKRGGLLGIGNIAQALGAEGLGQSLQTAAVPAAERAAAAQQQAIKGADTKTVQGLRATAQKLREAGNTAAALKLEEMADAKADAQAEAKFKEQELGIKKDEVAIKQAEALIKQLNAQTNVDKIQTSKELGISSDVIKNASVKSVAAALQYYQETGDRVGAVGMLQDKPTASTKVTVNAGDKAISKFKEKLGEEDAKNFVDINNAATTSVSSIATIERMQNLLDSPEGIYTGTLANVQTGLSKALNLVGMGDAEKVARTETFLTQGARETLNILGSGVVGAGTGISDKDREFIEKVVGGNITLSEEGIRDILRINKTVSMNALKTYNSKVDEYNSRYNENLPKKYYVGQKAKVKGTSFVYNGKEWVKEQ